MSQWLRKVARRRRCKYLDSGPCCMNWCGTKDGLNRQTPTPRPQNGSVVHGGQENVLAGAEGAGEGTAEVRIRELEVAMLEEYGLTLPPETEPLRGLWRRSQLNWRREALHDLRRAKARRELLRWVRRVLTLGLWWK